MIKHTILIVFFIFIYYITSYISKTLDSMFPEVISFGLYFTIPLIYDICILIWNNYIWKFFSGMSQIPPNINGIWNITIHSIDPHKENIVGKLIIKQTYDSINITKIFNNQSSVSDVAIIRNINGDWYLIYCYDTIKYNIINANPISSHDGFSKLQVLGNKKYLQLSGIYANYGINDSGNMTCIAESN